MKNCQRIEIVYEPSTSTFVIEFHVEKKEIWKIMNQKVIVGCFICQINKENKIFEERFERQFPVAIIAWLEVDDIIVL